MLIPKLSLHLTFGQLDAEILGIQHKVKNPQKATFACHACSLNVKFECWFSIHFTFIYYYKMLQIYELRIDQYIILDFFTSKMFSGDSSISSL